MIGALRLNFKPLGTHPHAAASPIRERCSELTLLVRSSRSGKCCGDLSTACSSREEALNEQIE